MGPSSPPISDELVDVLRRSQELGFLGARPIEQVIDHARSFVTALAALDVTGPILDLGAGGGVPGLVIAHDRPDQLVTLLDRRRTRTDFLARMVRRLGWQDRVDVWNRDAGDVTGDPLRRRRCPWLRTAQRNVGLRARLGSSARLRRDQRAADG